MRRARRRPKVARLYPLKSMPVLRLRIRNTCRSRSSRPSAAATSITFVGLGQIGVTADAGEFAGYLSGAEDKVDRAGLDGVAGHVILPGLPGILGEGDASLALYRLQSSGPVGAGAGKNDPDGSLVLIGGKRGEEVVDGQMPRW